jgi:hypothetical protein
MIGEVTGVNDVVIPMSLPLDSDGFLHRECPSCEREFRCWVRQASAADADDTGVAVDTYYCPYCYEPGGPDAWWTKGQLTYAKQLAAAEVLGPQLRDLQGEVDRVNQAGGLLRITAELSVPGRPEPLSETDDMVRIDVPCHPEEPLKLDAACEADVACWICGIRYPVDLVRALPEESEEV